jgi:hypothetical protein
MGAHTERTGRPGPGPIRHPGGYDPTRRRHDPARRRRDHDPARRRRDHDPARRRGGYGGKPS